MNIHTIQISCSAARLLGVMQISTMSFVDFEQLYPFASASASEQNCVYITSSTVKAQRH